MEDLILFENIYGWQLALIALLGIFLLGILKYKNVFKHIAKEKRKTVYLIITVGFSIISAVIYLAIVKQFTIDYILAVSAAIYALNQTFYTIYENTSLRELCCKLLDIAKSLIQNKKVE